MFLTRASQLAATTRFLERNTARRWDNHPGFGRRRTRPKNEIAGGYATSRVRGGRHGSPRQKSNYDNRGGRSPADRYAGGRGAVHQLGEPVSSSRTEAYGISPAVAAGGDRLRRTPALWLRLHRGP